MLKVWGRATSSNVQCVMWCIAELGLEVERIDAGLMYGVTKTPEYLAMNPNATIPTLVDGDHPPLWESGSILRYLANNYGADPFWPDDALERANVDRWAEWGKVSVQMSFSHPIFWKVVRTPAAERDTEQLQSAVTAFEDKLRIADQQLKQHPWLAGEQFTLADVMFGHILFRYYDIDIQRSNQLPDLQKYYTRLTDLDNYRKHVMVNYDELRAT